MREWALVVLAACYQPAPPEGAPCGDSDACPSGLHCFGGFCRSHELGNDAADDAELDSPVVPVDVVDGPPAWGTPTKVPGVNSASIEGDPSLTPDLLTIVFVSDRGGTDDIFLGTRAAAGDAFTVAAITTVNSAMAEASPEITADGNTLYFTSDRTGAFEVYRSTRTNNVFGAPAIVPDLSSTGNDGDLAISPDGLTAMVARDADLYIASRAQPSGAFGTLVKRPELDVTGTVAAPSITDGAAAVYFHAGTVRDLYVSHRIGNTFAAPAAITELNTVGRDAAPWISPDETHLAFERAGEIFESTR